MLIHILRTTLRSFRRQKLYALTIILSLACGLCFLALLTAFINQELSIDSHPQKKRIFRLLTDSPIAAGEKAFIVPKTTADYIEDNYPEVEHLTRMWSIDATLSTEDKRKEHLKFLAIDSSFFDVFQFNMQAGALTPGTLILTRRISDSGFEGTVTLTSTNVGNGTLHLERLFQISGILPAPDQSSHLRFDGLLRQEEIVSLYEWPPQVSVYLMLDAATDPSDFQAKLSSDNEVPDFIGKGQLDYYLQPLGDVYFDTQHQGQYGHTRPKIFIWISGVVVLLILLIAGFNYTNLFLLSLAQRNKELGLRKILGSGSGYLRLAILTEGIVYASIAFVLATVLAASLLPYFNITFGAELQLKQLFSLKILALYGAIIGMVTLCAMFYLSAQLGRVKSVVLVRSHRTSRIRSNRILLTLQFVITIGLVVSAVTIERQMRFIKNAPLGFNRELMILRVPPDSVYRHRLTGYKEAILLNGIVTYATQGNSPVGNYFRVGYILEDGTMFTPNTLSGDFDYLKTLKLDIIQGQKPVFSGTLVNEALVRHFEMERPIGEILPGTKRTVIEGVVRNFNMHSLHSDYVPTEINITTMPGATLLIDYSGRNLNTLLPALEDTWTKVFPDLTFSYTFIDDVLLTNHQADIRFAGLIVSFTIASTLLSCFGLLALASGITRNRTKEIGIRKTIGATTEEIFKMLTIDFSKWILLAFLIGAPIAGYFMNTWLESFAFRTELDVFTFLIAGGLVLILSLLMISGYSLRSARIDPVKELRSE